MSRHTASAQRQSNVSTSHPAARITRAALPLAQLLAQAVALADSPGVGVEGHSRSVDQWKVIEGLTPARLTPQEIERRIGRLIRASLNGRSATLASEIVRHIDALCAHPDDRRSAEERCVLRRMAGHWRRLAWIGDGGDAGGRPLPGPSVACGRPIAC